MDGIRDFFLNQLAQQAAEADRHLADSYWTDGRTGRNVGLDEWQAIARMRSVDLKPAPEERDDRERYRKRLIADLAVIADRFRAEAPDPDGYGIATIGTVIRNLTNFEAAPEAEL